MGQTLGRPALPYQGVPRGDARASPCGGGVDQRPRDLEVRGSNLRNRAAKECGVRVANLAEGSSRTSTRPTSETHDLH